MTAPHQRTARSGAQLRVLRAAVFAAVCVVLAAGGHALASCAAIPLWSLAAGFTAVFAVAAPLAGRERSLAGIAALLALGQTALHTLFGFGQHGTVTAAGTTGSMDAALVERAARLVCGAAAAAISPAQAQRILTDAGLSPYPVHAGHHPADAMSTAAGSSASVLPSLPMLLGHILAAVAAGWVLRHGDLALLRIARLSADAALVRSLRGALALARALRSGLTGTTGPAPRAVRTTREAPPTPRTTALQHTVIRRGPPFPGTALVLAA
ncbi:hypothetical protein [Streptomyces poonensis]|uniref:Integral membrane protein n=1 Tax=Streptomyces poonensis TaxID=68255 RepID=A0A918PVA0_9ACTN|nr:hypothetical protein [Streptomyces poonensis]GGZ24077.1 hypothetical protein GCM10010365_50360 [Streptomyces poonensis]GLJ89921.1 hypothetical protein GCM10017589_25220 [Streptomyces poonensis]